MISRKRSVETARNFQDKILGKKFHTVVTDPPWQFKNRTGKVAPEHERLNRYPTLSLNAIKNLHILMIQHISIYGYQML
jgi:hypothetical protein